jgi:hypothetical protein
MLNFRDHDRIVPAIESIHTPDVAGGNTLLTAAVDDDMLVGLEHEPVARCARCHGVGDFRCLGERLAGVLEAELFHRRRRELMRAMAAGAGKNFRTDNVGIAMVVRHTVFRLGYTRKHYPGPLRTC